jgi:hypothetical protein
MKYERPLMKSFKEHWSATRASFKLVGDQLEQVFRGIGEMQSLATGVGELKKMLSDYQETVVRSEPLRQMARWATMKSRLSGCILPIVGI